MINQIIAFELIKNFNGTKLEKVTILQQCSNNVCIFSNYSFIDFKLVNLISISVTMGELRNNNLYIKRLLINSLIELLSYILFSFSHIPSVLL